MLTQNALPFLTDLAKNNNKEWFAENKTWYQQAHQDFIAFVDDLIPMLAQTDPLLKGLTGKESVYRIYRDVRFGKDKTPYKNHFGAYIAPGGKKSKLSGFYVHVEPTGTSIFGGGVYGPEPPILKALRNEFYQVPEELLEIINDVNFKKHFEGLYEGGKLKTAPKGFPKDFEYIDLLRYKSYVATGTISKDELSSDGFMLKLVEGHQALYPLSRLINTIIEDANLV